MINSAATCTPEALNSIIEHVNNRQGLNTEGDVALLLLQTVNIGFFVLLFHLFVIVFYYYCYDCYAIRKPINIDVNKLDIN